MAQLAEVHGATTFVTEEIGAGRHAHAHLPGGGRAGRPVVAAIGHAAPARRSGRGRHTQRRRPVPAVPGRGPRAAALPAPVNPQMTRGRDRPRDRRHGRRWSIRDASELRRARARAASPHSRPHAVARRRRRRGALLHVGHHRPTQGCGADPSGARRSGVAAAAWPFALRHDEIVWRCRSRTSWGSSPLMGPADRRASRSTSSTGSRPTRVLDAHRAAVAARVHRGARRCTARCSRPAPATATSRRCGCGSAEPTSCPASWPAGSSRSAPRATLPRLGPVGEATFVEGYGMVEVGGSVAAKVSPPMLPFGLGDSLGLSMPGGRFKVADDRGPTSAARAGG